MREQDETARNELQHLRLEGVVGGHGPFGMDPLEATGAAGGCANGLHSGRRHGWRCSLAGPGEDRTGVQIKHVA